MTVACSYNIHPPRPKMPFKAALWIEELLFTHCAVTVTNVIVHRWALSYTLLFDTKLFLLEGSLHHQ